MKVVLFLLLLSGVVFAEQLLTAPLPTHDQLELRLADAAAQNQRAICATLWQQGNEFEHALKKLQEEHARLKDAYEKLQGVTPIEAPVR